MTLSTPQQPSSREIVQFGSWIKQQLFDETRASATTMPILTQRESSLITERLLQGRVDIETAYLKRLQLGREFYLGVKQQLLVILQAWDAIIDCKSNFDQLGQLSWDPQFIESFLLCTDTIPSRVDIGSLGPPDLQSSFVDVPSTYPVEPSLDSGNGDGHTYARHLPELVKGEDAQWDHNAEYLALSDFEVDDTTTEEGDEDKENDCYVDDSDDTDSVEFEEIPRPPTPYPWSASDESDEWYPALANLTNATHDMVENELSQLEEFATPREQGDSAQGGAPASTENGELRNSIEIRTEPTIKIEQGDELPKPAISNKRILDVVYGHGGDALDECRPRSKRSKRLRK